MSVSKVSGVAWSDVSKVNGVSNADVNKVLGVEAASSPAPSLTTDNLWIDIRPYVGVSGTTITDQSGNGRNASLINSASVTTTPTNETAFYVDGVSQAVLYSITSSSEKPSTGFPFTTEVWMYRDDTQNSTASIAVWGKPQNSRYRNFYTVMVDDDATAFGTDGMRFFPRFYTNLVTDNDNDFRDEGLSEVGLPSVTGQDSGVVGSPSSPHTYTLSSDTSDHTWYHLVTSFYENSNGELSMDFWVNGVNMFSGFKNTKNQNGNGDNVIINAAYPWEGNVGSASPSDDGFCPMEWGIGRVSRGDFNGGGGIDYYDGYYGGYRMYTKKLTNAEVSNNFNATKTNYGY